MDTQPHRPDTQRERNPERLPSVERLLQASAAAILIERYGRRAVTDALRARIDAARPAWREGAPVPSEEALIEGASERLEEASRPSLRPVVNATGIILHTGLGRAVLPRAAMEQAMSVMAGHSALEVNVATGERGSRHEHVESHLIALTGAEAAIAVNNDAGAVLLALSALARGREVVVSRGELVEIGGGFRVPDVMRESGATLVEVGTTNKTRTADYERAVTPNTAALLKVHPSNFRVVGFTESASLEDVAAVARLHGIPLLDDLGSGALVDVRGLGLGDEPPVPERLRQGADVVMFSGDKLLGGPQAGIIVGRKDLVDAMRTHPLARALRCDKVTLAALEATLRLYRQGRAWEEVPTLRALALSPDDVRRHAVLLAEELNAIRGVQAEVIPSRCRAGAGSLPGEELPSFAVAVEIADRGPNALADQLRANDPPVFAHIESDRLLFEPRTLLPGDDALVVKAVRDALAP